LSTAPSPEPSAGRRRKGSVFAGAGQVLGWLTHQTLRTTRTRCPIEVCSFPAHLDYHDLGQVRPAHQRIEQLGLEPYSLHAPFAEHIDITSLDQARRLHARDELLRAAKAAGHLRARYLVIHPSAEQGGFPEEERFHRMENAARVLTEISHESRARDVVLVLENMLPHLFSRRVQELLWILGALETTDVGICLDTGHAHLSGTCAPWHTSCPGISG